MVAKYGSIARAGEQLFLSPQSISSQLGELENALGTQLFKRIGRRLELTETGKRIYVYAEEIFALGNELMDVIQSQKSQKTLTFRVGIADSISKSVAHRVLEPSLKGDNPIRLTCREGKLTSLLGELAIHRLDMVIADRPLPVGANIRAYSHLLGESAISVMGTKSLLKDRDTDHFPAMLNRAPFLLPGEDFAIHAELLRWFESQRISPRIVGEFDDSALLKLFGQGGAGFFIVPTAMNKYVRERYDVIEVGRIDSIKEQLFAITAERRMAHPGVIAVAEATRQVFSGM
jgi:LysR family transcriptional activator of nhaA